MYGEHPKSETKQKRPGDLFETSTARLAQSVERTALNRVVVGSSPTVGDFFFEAVSEKGGKLGEVLLLHGYICRITLRSR